MKRTFTFILLTVFLCMASFTVTSGSTRTYFNSGKYFLEKNSPVLYGLKNAESKSKKQYLDTLKSAENMNTAGFTVKIGEDEVFISYDDYTEMLMVKQKLLLPEQTKYAWEMASANYDITYSTMLLGLRDLYMGLLSALDSYSLENNRFLLANTVYEQESYKFENGLISPLQMQEAEYNLLKAQKGLDASLRNLENMTRSYNAYIGVDISAKYDEVIYSEEFSAEPLEDVGVYVQKALCERTEIVSIKRQLELVHLQLEALETNRIHQIYTSAQREYKDAMHSIDIYELNLQKTRLEIEKEVKQAYADIVNEIRNVENFSDMLKLQRNNYEKIKKNYELGLVSKNLYLQTEISLKQTENSFKLSVYSLNTKLMRFEYACGAGPGYR